jgi:hypothetical protein
VIELISHPSGIAYPTRVAVGRWTPPRVPLRSLQTHPTTGHSDLVGVDDDDGTAETWFDDLAGLEAVLGSPTCRERAFPTSGASSATGPRRVG